MPQYLPRTLLRINIRNWSLIALATLIYYLSAMLPLPAFSEPAHKTFSIFCVAAFLWITSAFPIAVTGILILFLLPLTGALSPVQVYSYFGNNAVFFVLGAFILASPVMRSGLSTRLAVTLISHFGRGPKRLLFSIFALSSLLSFIISEHAVAAVLFPIIIEIIKAADLEPGHRYGFAAMLSMGWGAIIGGTATLLGGARAPLALGMLESTTNQSISFLNWVQLTLPCVFLALVCAFLLILKITQNTDVNIKSARAQLELHHSTMGNLSLREVKTLGVLLLTVFLWIVYGSHFGLELVAFFGVILAFALGITNWQEVEEDVHWGIFVMYGGAIALGAALRDTGAAEGIVSMVIDLGVTSPFLIFTLLIGVAFILTEAMSNAASVAVILPIGLALAQQYHIDPRAIAVGIATAAGLTFLLPVSTPAMAIITNNEYVNSHLAFRWGVLLKLGSFCILVLTTGLYWPSVGVHIG